MRILHVITALDRGGAENHLADLVRGQIAAGHRVCIAYLKGGGWWADTLRAAGADVASIGIRRWLDPSALLRLIATVRRFRPDVVHGHLTPAEPYAWAAHLLAGRGAAWVVSKHNDDPCGLERGYRPVTRYVTAHARRVIAISAAVARFLPPLGIEPERIRVIRYGLDATAWERPDQEAVARLRNAWGGTVVIGCIARLVPQKAHAVLLAGFARAATPGWRLVLVGSGPLEDAIRAESHRLGIAAQVVWAGQRSDMAEVMASFDALALTSIYEGLGLVLLEAMAAGRPVVASAVSAIPEIIGEDGKAGILVPPSDPEALGIALRRVADPPTAAAMGAAGRLRVAAHFSLASMVSATDAAYAEALACAG